MIAYRDHLKQSAEVRREFEKSLQEGYAAVDRVFAKLLLAQWLIGILCACFISPWAWNGVQSSIHVHVWAAIVLGGMIVGFPLILIGLAPGRLATRLAVAVGQLSFSALLIHLMGGRIESHFHVFVSLALLSSYRDRSVLVPAVAIPILDHFVRGFYWPQSIFGVSFVTPWRPLEHSTWILFEAISLCFLIHQSFRQLLQISKLRCFIQEERDQFETRVAERTRELNDGKEFQNRILNSIDAEVCILDAAGMIVFVNERWREHSRRNGGSEMQTGVGVNYVAVCEADNGINSWKSREIARAIRAIAEGQRDTYSTEYRCEGQDRILWYHLVLNVVPLGGYRAICMMHIDISESKAAKSRADAIAKLILDSPNEVYIFSADDLRLIEVNHGACRNLGYERSDLLQKTLTEFASNIDDARFRTQVKSLANGVVDMFNCEVVHCRRDGSKYICNLTLCYNQLDGLPVIVAFATDMTHQKLLEEKLTHAQKLESVGQLAAGIAHEINSPMQCVFGNVEFLQSSCQNLLGLSDRIVELLKEQEIDWTSERESLFELREKSRYDYLRLQTPAAIQEASEASSRVISIIRAMKVISHPGHAEKSLSDIDDMIKNAATITRGRWKKCAQVEFDFDRELSAVEVLPAEIGQVFINLIVNAADAIAERFGEESNELGLIRIVTRIQGDMATIRFIDNGAGIPESIRHRIFDPFFTTKEVGKGTGQGLSVSRNVIVNRHSGTLEVSSELGRGTTFEIQIPRFAQPKMPISPPVLRSHAATSTMTPSLNIP